MTPDQKVVGRYRWIGGLAPVLAPGDGSVTVYACKDCGAWTDDRITHDRFHATLDKHAKAIAVLIGAHLAEHTHDRYDVKERIGDG